MQAKDVGEKIALDGETRHETLKGWQMTMADAIYDGFRKSLTSRGRTSRDAYWKFFPVALVLPVAYASQMDWLEIHVWKGMAKLAGLFIFSIPFMNATARRLNDAGFDSSQAYMPFAPLTVLWVAYQVILWVGYGVAALGGAWIILVWLVALIVLLPLHIIAFFLSILATSTVIGQTLVASEPGSNRYGPNPHEVPQ